MKKIYTLTLVFIGAVQFSAQTNLVIEAPLNNNTRSNVRAPNGTINHAYMSACYLVKQSELYNMPNGVSLTSFGYTLGTGVAGTPVSGNFTVFLQNTTDVTYQKGTNFSAALGGMTSVYASVMTIPVSAVTTSVMVTLSGSFNYGGGGLYIAYDWNSTGPFVATGATYLGETTALPLPGGAGAISFSPSGAVNTLTLTSTRPSFLFGFTNTNTNDVEVVSVMAPGRVPAMLNSAHQITALVRNISTVPVSNIPVSVSVGGANLFTNTQMVGSLGAGATALVTFNAFNPNLPGLNTISVTVPSDQNNLNNQFIYQQSVTCNEWSANPPIGSYTINQVGFNTGAGILGMAYTPPVNASITAIRTAISTNTQSINQSVYAVLLSNAGAIIATTAPKILTQTMLGTFQTFTFATPQSMTGATTYYLGLAQTTGTIGYHPAGTIGAYYLPPTYAYTGINGGVMTVLTDNFGYFGIEAVFLPNISLSVTPKSVSCGNTATMEAISSTNYSWSTGAQTSSIVVSPIVSTPYSVTATNTLGCSLTKTVMLTVTPLALTGTISANTVCLGDSVVLSAGGALTYTWSTNSNAPTIIHYPQSSMVYSLRGDNLAGCTNTIFIPVSVQSFSTLNVPLTSTTVCRGKSVYFSAGSAASYTWETGSSTINTNTISTTPTASGVYTITGANAFGCKMSKTVSVTVNAMTITASADTAICNGATITLAASGGNNYMWEGFSPFPTYMITPSVTATYSVRGTDQNGCKDSTQVTVTVNNNPTVTATASRTLMCKNDKHSISAKGADTYSWSTGETTSSISVTPLTTQQQTIIVTGYNQFNCKSTASVQIVVSGCTDLQDLSSEYIANLFPNPTMDIVHVNFHASMQGRFIEVLNLLGEKVMVFDAPDKSHVVDLREKPNGVYIIQITENHKIVTSKKIIRQ